MDALLVGAVLFASVVPASVPARTPVRFTGAGGPIRGRVVMQTSEIYVVETGTGERLTLPQPGRTLRGRIVSVDDGVMSVLLDEKQPVARVPLASVRDVRVSRGRVSAWNHGVLIGMTAGAIVGAALVGGECGGGFGQCTVGGGAALFGVIGAVAGGTVGAFLKRENWEPIEPGAFKVAVQPVRRGAGVAVAFGLPRR